jgi:hypothetical protein
MSGAGRELLRGALPLRRVRYVWPILLLIMILWFPFDWLSTVWPAFGVPFRRVFQDAHDHFIGHLVFFLVTGFLILTYVPALRRKPLWYAFGLVLAALGQETIQAFARGELPAFNDWNAFRGDALGGVAAFLLFYTWSKVSIAVKTAAHRTGSPGCGPRRATNR